MAAAVCGWVWAALGASGMAWVEPDNATALRNVFFSGQPHLISCKNDHSQKDHPLFQSVQTSWEPTQLVATNCKKKMASGKNLNQRFKLDDAVNPVIIIAANGNPPTQVLPSMLQKAGLQQQLFPTMQQMAHALQNLVKLKSEPKLRPLTSAKQMHTHCLKRKHCALILHRGASPPTNSSKVVSKLLRQYRTVSFLSLNTDRYTISLANKLPEIQKGQAQLVAFRSSVATVPVDEKKKRSATRKQKRKSDTEGGKKSYTLSAKAHRGEFNLGAIGQFLDSVTDGSLQMPFLKKLPDIKWKKDRKKRPQEADGSSKARRTKSSSSNMGKKRSSSKLRPGRVLKDEDIAALERDAELRKRQRMAEEEEEAVRGLFDDESDDDSDAVQDEDDDDDELRLDDEVGEEEDVEWTDNDSESCESAET